MRDDKYHEMDAEMSKKARYQLLESEAKEYEATCAWCRGRKIIGTHRGDIPCLDCNGKGNYILSVS